MPPVTRRRSDRTPRCPRRAGRRSGDGWRAGPPCCRAARPPCRGRPPGPGGCAGDGTARCSPWRSEERRVGKEGRVRGAAGEEKKKRRDVRARREVGEEEAEV